MRADLIGALRLPKYISLEMDEQRALADAVEALEEAVGVMIEADCASLSHVPKFRALLARIRGEA